MANHPDWLAAHAAHGVVAAERQALQAELSEIDETLAERGTSLRDRGMAALAAAHTGNAVATVEVDVVALQARRKKVADRIAVLQAAEAHSTARMHHYTPEAPPLRMEISLDVCQQNAKEYAALMTKVLAMGLQLQKAVKTADALLIDLERGQTEISDPLRRVWSPFGNVSKPGNPLDNWITDLEKYLMNFRG